MNAIGAQGACPHDCPDTCGTFIDVEDGRAVAFYGQPDHEITQGWLSGKVRPYLEHVYNPERLMFPLRRIGPEGSGRWQRITWEDAVAEIASQWMAIIDDFGTEAILPYSYGGTLRLLHMTVSSARFRNRLGASQPQRNKCGVTAERAVEATLGVRWSQPYSAVINSHMNDDDPRNPDGSTPSNRAASSLSLISAAAHHFISSTFAYHSRFLEIEGHPFMRNHPADALLRGIRQGEKVIVENRR